jgi:ATP synthase protein I
MTDEPDANRQPDKNKFGQQVGSIAERKLNAQRQVTRTVWSGLGMMGLVGWSVAIPTLLGAMLGLWVDKRFPGDHSWTLALLAVGLVLGCFNAWHWIVKEDREIHQHGTERKANQDRKDNHD